MKKSELPEGINGWVLRGITYKKGGKAATFNEEDGTLSVGIYIPAGAKLFEGKVDNPEEVKDILSRY